MPTQELIGEVEAALRGALESKAPFQSALELIAGAFEARTTTLHYADSKTRFLFLVADIGLPDGLRAVTTKIPYGKGMAGICVERKDVVSVCNLQTDSSGVAKPGAKETRVAGAIVVPVFARDGFEVVGTLGIGKSEEHEYSEAEKALIAECAKTLGPALETWAGKGCPGL